MSGFVDPLHLDAYQFQRFRLLDPDRAAVLLRWAEARQASEGFSGPMFSVRLGEGWVEIVKPIVDDDGEIVLCQEHIATHKLRMPIDSPPPCWPTPVEMEAIT